MARAQLKLTVPPAVKAELEQRFKAADAVRQRQRLQAILLATTGRHGYRDIAQIVDSVRHKMFVVRFRSSYLLSQNS